MLLRGVDARGRALQVKAAEAEGAERGSRPVNRKSAKERQRLDEQRRRDMEEHCAKVRRAVFLLSNQVPSKFVTRRLYSTAAFRVLNGR